jgi:hypothetical protein
MGEDVINAYEDRVCYPWKVTGGMTTVCRIGNDDGAVTKP